MKIIQDAVQTAKAVQEHHIDQYFSTRDLPFQLHQYEKGEFLCSPFKPLDDFLFLVNGSVYLYDVRQDGGVKTSGKAGGLIWPYKGLIPAASKDALNIISPA